VKAEKTVYVVIEYPVSGMPFLDTVFPHPVPCRDAALAKVAERQHEDFGWVNDSRVLRQLLRFDDDVVRYTDPVKSLDCHPGIPPAL
jgi:hypothetical protein